jgi:serine protease inhibitor
VDEKGAEAAAATVVMIDLSHWWATVATRATNSFTSPLAVFASDVLMNNFCFAHYNTRMWPTDVRCSTSRSRKPDIRFIADHSFLLALVKNRRHVLFLGRYAVPA